MTDVSAGEVTALLAAMRSGDADATNRLMQVVYADLRAMAGRRMNRVPNSDTLQPTALVHECFLRLTGNGDVQWNDRRHFFALAARAMHDIIVEQARRHQAKKRGGDHRRVSLDEAELTVDTQCEDLLLLSAALERLQQHDTTSAEVVMLRFFSGLTHEQVALALDLPVIRVRREWQYAKAYLQKELSEGGRES